MKSGNDISLVLVCSDCVNTRILYHGISNDIAISHIITELPVSRKHLIRRRIKRLGLWTTIGQLIFQVGVVPLMRKLSKNRIQEIIKDRHLKTLPMPGEKIIKIPSVNSKEFTEVIRDLKPDIILVNGTRIISSATLAAINCPIINVHVGITPLYRGVHGAYWALANSDASHCGVTVHRVDKGIDTGSILAQDIITPGKKDNFITYPYLQMDKAIALVKKLIPRLASDGCSPPDAPPGQSKLWYHPTIWQYLSNRLKGVK